MCPNGVFFPGRVWNGLVCGFPFPSRPVLARPDRPKRPPRLRIENCRCGAVGFGPPEAILGFQIGIFTVFNSKNHKEFITHALNSYVLTIDSKRSRLGDFFGDHQESQFHRKTTKNQEKHFLVKQKRKIFVWSKKEDKHIFERKGKSFSSQKEKGTSIFLSKQNGE